MIKRWISIVIVLFIIGVNLPQYAFADALDGWNIRSPLPTGNLLNGVVFGNSTFVAVGDNGTIITSSDGVSWTSRTSGTTIQLYGITYGNGKFVAVGLSGTILTSSDGVSWTSQTSNTTNHLVGVAFGNNTYVAVGYAGAIVTSSNGTSWTSQSISSSSLLEGVTFGNSKFMTVGGAGMNATSSNGVSWTTNTSIGAAIFVYGVTYGSSKYVAVASGGTIVASSNGTSWANQTSKTTNSLNGVGFLNNMFVAVGDIGTIVTSSNGTSWTNQTSGTTNNLRGVAYGNGTYVAVGASGTVLTSSNGTAWTSRMTGTTSNLNSVTYGNGTYVTVGVNGTIASSSNGVNWTSRTSGSTKMLLSVTYGNGTFVAVGEAGEILTSRDGADWTRRTSSAGVSLTGVTYANGKFLVVGYNRTIVTSSDGESWTSGTNGPVNTPLRGVAYGNGTYVAVGDVGVNANSNDGVSWSSRSLGTSIYLYGVTYGNGNFVAVGQNGKIVTSSFGVSWTSQTSGTMELLLGVTYGNGTYVAVGANGTILTSSNGVNWTNRTSGSTNALVGVIFANSTYVSAGSIGTIVQSDPVPLAINSVSVNPASAIVAQGDSKQLSATVDAIAGVATTVTWSSSDAKVAVDGTGKVTVAADAVPGDYTITATSTVDDSKKGTATITVTVAPKVNSVSVTPASASVAQGDSKQLSAEVDVVGGAATTVTWTSSDASNKVAVNGTGYVTVATDTAPGTYTITATSTVDIGKKGTATITVIAAPAINSVSVSPNSASVTQGGSKQLTATVNAVGGAATTVTWTSSDASNKVAVNGTGYVTVATDTAPGTYTITATSTVDIGKKGTATITVTAAPAINSVSVSPNSASVTQGGSKQLTATVDVVGGAATTVTWTSSDAGNKVAVNGTGYVTVAADATPGTYTITATSTEDNTKTGTATIIVTATTAINGVNVSPGSASVVQGGSEQLTATVDAVGGAGTTVTWTSSDAGNKVAVNGTGYVTVAADATPGTYTITATSTEDSTKTGTATIIVTATTAINSVNVSPGSASVVQGGSEQLTATVDAVGGAGTTVTWTSSDAGNKVAVNGTGYVTVAADATPGTYTITATSTEDNTKTGTATIIVTATTAINSVNVSPNSASVTQGGSKQLTATVDVVGGAATTVTWTSSDAGNKVAVNGTGYVKVAADAAPGTYTITATSTEDNTKTGTATIIVTATTAINSVNVSPGSASVVQGESEQLTATVDAVGGADTTVTWTSSDAGNKVAVNGTGYVTVAADATPGTYTITATSTVNNSKKGTATITVTAMPPAINSVSVSPSTASVVQGESEQLTATVDAVGGADTTVTWTSSDSKVTVDTTGKVTVAADAVPGNYTITATSTVNSSKKGTATITVTVPPAVNGVTVSPSTASVVQGGSEQLTATVDAVGGADTTVTWTSSDVKVTVDTTGKVTVAADAVPGNYTITATSTVNIGKKGSATITVTAAPSYTIAAITDQTLTALTQGYVSGIQETRPVTIANTGTGQLANLSVTLSGANANDFVITQPDSTLTNGESTSFDIHAKDGLPAGTYTATVTVSADHLTPVRFIVTQAVNLPNAPANPQNLAATSGDRQITLSWNAVPEATQYHIYMATDADLTSIVEVATVTSSTYSVSNLANGTAYYFVIKSENLGGLSAASNQVSVTPATVPGAPFNVTAVAGNGQAVVTFTAPIDNGGSTITEYEVTASPGDVVVTGGTSPITLTGLTNGTSYTFTVKAVNGAGRSSASAESNTVTPRVPSTPSEPSTPTTPVDANTGVDILVNGKAENAGTATIGKRDNQSEMTVVVDQKKLEEKLAAEGQHAVVTIPISQKFDIVVGELNGQMVKNMEDKQAVLEFKTDHATYTLPARQINIGVISEQVGELIALQDIKVRIEIAVPTADTLKVVQNAAVNGQLALVAQPLNFTVRAVYGDKIIEVTKFDAYVERTISIPEEVDPSKITTGVVVEGDGSVRHVPTKVRNINGKYEAQINSLTNSTYAVVWHPLEFSDAANHWAQNAINEMGSRMVVDGTGNGMFSPDREITRAEFTAIIVRGLGLKLENGTTPFADVKPADWYSSAVNTAYAYRLISGLEDGTFRPNDTITREQAMVILAKAMAITSLKDKLLVQSADDALRPFEDAAGVSSWAQSSVADSVQAGLVYGRSETILAPKGHLTRAEVATMMQRLLQKSSLI